MLHSKTALSCSGVIAGSGSGDGDFDGDGADHHLCAGTLASAPLKKACGNPVLHPSLGLSVFFLSFFQSCVKGVAVLPSLLWVVRVLLSLSCFRAVSDVVALRRRRPPPTLAAHHAALREQSRNGRLAGFLWLFGRLFGFSRLPTPLLSFFSASTTLHGDRGFDHPPDYHSDDAFCEEDGFYEDDSFDYL